MVSAGPAAVAKGIPHIYLTECPGFVCCHNYYFGPRLLILLQLWFG